MDTLSFMKELLSNAALQVRERMLQGYDVAWKNDNTPVTDIDFLVTDIVTKALEKYFPNDALYGEEEARTDGKSGYTWVLDPIDGTQALGLLPTSTICLARVAADGLPEISVVMNPFTDEMFYFENGNSFCNEKVISVSKKDTIKSSYFLLGSGMRGNYASNGVIYDAIEGRGGKIFNTRSLAYSCMLVALGKAEGAYVGVKTPFEAASVKLIIEGAGGKATDLQGNDNKRYDQEINGLIVSNGTEIHDLLVEFAQNLSKISSPTIE